MPSLARSSTLVYGALALAVLALGGRWLASHGGSAAGGGAATGAATAPAGRAGGAGSPVVVRSAPRAAVVHVAGAVRRPGVYRLAAGDRVQDAVRRAGGPTARGDVGAINLAAPVEDGVRVVVPERPPRVAAGAGAAPAAGAAAGDGAAAAPPVDLNTATAEQLETLDGVGPATAARILDHRRAHGGFRTVEDLGQVPGIGPKRLAALRDRVRT